MALYLVATPIGNLKDITVRAIEVLTQVDLIAAEDTRTTVVLLNHLQIQSELISYHAHNAHQRDDHIIQLLNSGKDIALVSDAGTPLVSDPGFSLVRAAIAANVNVIPIPGPSSLITAICASGLRTDRFIFEGFLPQKKGARDARLRRVQYESRSIILFESTHRIIALLEEISSIMGGDRKIALAKELTKHFERFFRGTVEEVLESLQTEPNFIKGEFVLVIEGCENERQEEVEKAKILFSELCGAMSHRDSVALATKIFTLGRNELYEIAASFY